VKRAGSRRRGTTRQDDARTGLRIDLNAMPEDAGAWRSSPHLRDAGRQVDQLLHGAKAPLFSLYRGLRGGSHEQGSHPEGWPRVGNHQPPFGPGITKRRHRFGIASSLPPGAWHPRGLKCRWWVARLIISTPGQACRGAACSAQAPLEMEKSAFPVPHAMRHGGRAFARQSGIEAAGGWVRFKP
jgi:hypothetical protein